MLQRRPAMPTMKDGADTRRAVSCPAVHSARHAPVVPVLPASRLPRPGRLRLRGAGALLSLSLSAVLGSLLARQSEQDARAALRTVVHNAAYLLAEGLHHRLREVQVLAAPPTLWRDGIAATGVSEALMRSQAIEPHSAWIGVADTRGTVRAATGQLLVG
jgi:hypothetical protein